MGCGSSKVYVVNNDKPGQGDDCLDALRVLRLSDEDINVLYKSFQELDVTGDGEVTLLEFLTVMNLGMTYYSVFE